MIAEILLTLLTLYITVACMLGLCYLQEVMIPHFKMIYFLGYDSRISEKLCVA